MRRGLMTAGVLAVLGLWVLWTVWPAIRGPEELEPIPSISTATFTDNYIVENNRPGTWWLREPPRPDHEITNADLVIQFFDRADSADMGRTVDDGRTVVVFSDENECRVHATPKGYGILCRVATDAAIMRRLLRAHPRWGSPSYPYCATFEGEAIPCP